MQINGITLPGPQGTGSRMDGDGAGFALALGEIMAQPDRAPGVAAGIAAPTIAGASPGAAAKSLPFPSEAPMTPVPGPQIVLPGANGLLPDAQPGAVSGQSAPGQSPAGQLAAETVPDPIATPQFTMNIGADAAVPAAAGTLPQPAGMSGLPPKTNQFSGTVPPPATPTPQTAAAPVPPPAEKPAPAALDMALDQAAQPASPVLAAQGNAEPAPIARPAPKIATTNLKDRAPVTDLATPDSPEQPQPVPAAPESVVGQAAVAVPSPMQPQATPAPAVTPPSAPNSDTLGKTASGADSNSAIEPGNGRAVAGKSARTRIPVRGIVTTEAGAAAPTATPPSPDNNAPIAVGPATTPPERQLAAGQPTPPQATAAPNIAGGSTAVATMQAALASGDKAALLAASTAKSADTGSGDTFAGLVGASDGDKRAPVIGAAALPGTDGSAVTARVPTSLPAAVAPPAATAVATISAQPGRIGHEAGVAIARRITDGGEEVTLRLNPAELGRIEVRIGFEDGNLRATMRADSGAALDLLRRDSADLGRALDQAGVRADAGSFRFEGGTGNGGQPGAGRQQQSAATGSRHDGSSDDTALIPPSYRPLRTSGRVDLVA